jgi:hypothetical protein
MGKDRHASKGVGRKEVFFMTVKIGKEVKFELCRAIEDIRLKTQVPVPLKRVLRVGVISFNLAVVETYPGR